MSSQSTRQVGQLPVINQLLIHSANSEERMDPMLLERLAMDIEAGNTALWDDLNVHATKLAEGDDQQRQRLMGIGMHVIHLFTRDGDVAAMEQRFAEQTQEDQRVKRSKRVRGWFAGHAAMLGLGVTFFRKPKDGDGALG